MAKANSTSATPGARKGVNTPPAPSAPAPEDFVGNAMEFCRAMEVFVRLAEREVREMSYDGADPLEFLIKGAKAEIMAFGRLGSDLEEAMAKGGAA